MASKISRRGFVAAASSAPLVAIAEPQNQTAAAPNPDIVETTSGDLVVAFDQSRGVLHSIRAASDPLRTNFIGNETNVRRATAGNFLGDLITTVWAVTDASRLRSDLGGGTSQTAGGWRQELTGHSADIRTVSWDGKLFQVDYHGKSKEETGLHNYDLRMRYTFPQAGVLDWELQLKNTTGLPLEIGELAFPFLLNDDYGAYGTENSSVLANTEARQRNIHENKVLSFHYVGGHSSYSLLVRPMGSPPFLLIQPMDGTSYECMYRGSGAATPGPGAGGPDRLAVHSHAPRQMNRWREPWVNGHSSLMLEPGEERSYRLRFQFVQDYPQIRDEIAAAGNIAIRVLPSMVVPEGLPAYVELRSQEPIARIEPDSTGITVESRRRTGDRELLTLGFQGRGQKTVRLEYGDHRWTNLHFYCVEDIAERLKARGRFIVEREFYDNPSDPYHRHHMFLPFDYATQSTFLDSEEVWEVGGSDEFGFSEALFLAEKNVHYPSKREIATLETYVTDCLFKYIQNPETYTVRASLYWKTRTPSMPWSCWSERRSESTARTYNYAHPANIYHALYKIGKQYDLTTHRRPLDYLRMSYRTALVWFVTGEWRHIGIMGGSNAVQILEDLKTEGWNDEYDKLRAEMMACDKKMVDDPYPFSSELTIDQTAHEQVYFFTKYFGDTGKNQIAMRVIKALRAGNEPHWFRYGQDRRNYWSCWYSESLNGMALLDAFEKTGDPDMFVKGFAGVMSVSKNLLPDGMCFSEFVWNPGTFAHYPAHTREGGVGQWGFLKGMRSFVLRDEAFGLIGAGCLVQQSAGKVRVTPKDGLRKTVVWPEKKMRIALTQGEIEWIDFDRASQGLQLSLTDTTGIVSSAVFRIDGLGAGRYRVNGRTHDVTGALELTLPMADAKSISIVRA